MRLDDRFNTFVIVAVCDTKGTPIPRVLLNGTNLRLLYRGETDTPPPSPPPPPPSVIFRNFAINLKRLTVLVHYDYCQAQFQLASSD